MEKEGWKCEEGSGGEGEVYGKGSGSWEKWSELGVRNSGWESRGGEVGRERVCWRGEGDR